MGRLSVSGGAFKTVVPARDLGFSTNGRYLAWVMGSAFKLQGLETQGRGSALDWSDNGPVWRMSG